jgi:ubiquinone/menaquinone biosynthesis C-methylase UbiE
VEKAYLPAAGRDWALPLYDPIVKLLGIDSVRRELLNQSELHVANRVLDIGCGTGSLLILIKRLHPDLDVAGLDPDSRALVIAKRKAARRAVLLQIDQGYSDHLPYPDASFDRVLSSFMFHHLEPDQKRSTLSEARRVLKPGGSFHMVDFAEAKAGTHGWLSGLFHSSSRLEDNSESRILALMGQAGFSSVKKIMNGALLFGGLRIAYFQASVSAI